MSERDILLFVDDAIESICAIEDFTRQIEYDFFISDRKTYSATLREFIVIGEAMGKIPDDIMSGNGACPPNGSQDLTLFVFL